MRGIRQGALSLTLSINTVTLSVNTVTLSVNTVTLSINTFVLQCLSTSSSNMERLLQLVHTLAEVIQIVHTPVHACCRLNLIGSRI